MQRWILRLSFTKAVLFELLDELVTVIWILVVLVELNTIFFKSSLI